MSEEDCCTSISYHLAKWRMWVQCFASQMLLLYMQHPQNALSVKQRCRIIGCTGRCKIMCSGKAEIAWCEP